MLNRFFHIFQVKKPKALLLKHKGEFFNLKEIYEHINHQYFENKLNLHISWAGSKEVKPRRRVMLGSYTPDKRLIKIHRRLDQSHIPFYFISFIVYHEMLHHVLPPIKKRNQKRKIHHPLFLSKEKEFEHYSLAKDFAKKMHTSWFKH